MPYLPKLLLMLTTFAHPVSEQTDLTPDCSAAAIASENVIHHETTQFNPAHCLAAAPPETGTNGGGLPIDALRASKLYREYERAFSESLGLPLVLRAVESWQLPYRGKRSENLFCAMIATRSRSCASCLRTTQRLSMMAAERPATITCPTGLTETAVPVRLNHRLVGFLQTGQVFNKAPNQLQFERTTKLLSQWGVTAREEHLRDLYFGTRMMTAQQHQAVVSLLTIFGQHLSLVGEQIIAWERNSEPPIIARAKAYILEHQSEDLSLGQIARAVNASSFYFCKLFKKSTGINFVDYLSRLRIDKAKNLLMNPNCLISEIAFEVGFQSLTHFNRVFKKHTGHSPSSYRAQLPTS
jgi:AraC-like DNA-binding protein/ligand-binding sensor protein